MCLWCCSSMLFNGLTFRKVDHSMSSAFLHRWNLQNSSQWWSPILIPRSSVLLRQEQLQRSQNALRDLEASTDASSRLVFLVSFLQRQKPAKASHAKGDVCVFLARDQQSWRTVRGAVVCVRSLWLEVWPKVWGILEATQSPLTYSSWRCKDPMDFSIFPRWHVKCRTLFAWCLHFHKKTPVRPSLPREFQADSPPGLHCMSPTFGTPEPWKGQKPCNGSMHSFRVWLIFLFPPFQMKCGCVFP